MRTEALVTSIWGSYMLLRFLLLKNASVMCTMCSDWSLGVSIGRSVHQYRTNGLSVWMITKQIVRFLFALKGGGKSPAVGKPQQLNKRVTAAPQDKSRD